MLKATPVRDMEVDIELDGGTRVDAVEQGARVLDRLAVNRFVAGHVGDAPVECVSAAVERVDLIMQW